MATGGGFWVAAGEEEHHPSVEYVLGSGLGRLVRRATGDQKSEDREDWHQFLSEYGYEQVEVMDDLVARYLRTGLIRAPELLRALEEVRTSEHRRAAEREFGEAWELFHDSFAPNQDAVLDALAASLRKSLLWTSPNNVSATTTLFRELGRDAEAEALANEYVEMLKRHAPETLDLRDYPFADHVTDAKLKEAMALAHAATAVHVPLREAAERLRDGVRWTAAETEALERATVDDLVALLHDLRGRELTDTVHGLLRFGSTSRSDHHLVSRRALDALRRIEQESALNRLRMRRYYPLPQFPPPPRAAGEHEAD